MMETNSMLLVVDPQLDFISGSLPVPGAAEAMDRLAQLNNINLDKYSRTSRGWQGRLRMTMRNILARKTWDIGYLIDFHGDKINAPADWIEAQKYKK